RPLRSCPVGSPYGPGDGSSGQMQGLPGSAHSVSVHARGLRPRQVRLRLAITAYPLLPSACAERVSTQDWPISGLHTLPARSPVNASPAPLPTPAPDAGPVWLAGPSLAGTCTLHHCAGLSRRLPERRDYAATRCTVTAPALFSAPGGSQVACYLYDLHDPLPAR